MLKFTTTMLCVAIATATVGSVARADLLVYEPFDYITGPLVGQTGGIGFAAPWGPAEQGGTVTVFSEQTGFWDGVVNNVPTTPAVGARYVSSSGTSDRLTAQRVLSQSAGDLAGGDNVLWASIVWRMDGTNFGRQVGFALGTDGLSNRSQNVDKTGNFGAGLGDAIGVGGGINTGLVTPVIFDNGNIAQRNTTGATSVNFGVENIVVLKYTFADGAAPDTVAAYTFTENATLLESTFNSSAIAASAVINQDTLNILSFSQTNRGQEAIDEIRLGDTFDDVVSGIITPPPLKLEVNVVSGAVALIGDADEPLDINYYQITSNGNSLNPADWNSLADQDFEGNGPVNGSGNGWEEGGNPSSHALSEGFLLGDSTIPTTARIGIGQAYDSMVNARDLEFRYRIDTGQVFDGLVEYILPGDYNDDGQVNAADYNTWRSTFGQTGTGLAADGNDNGVVDAADYTVWRDNLGVGTQPAAGLLSVPEPTSVSVMIVGVSAMSICLVGRHHKF